MKKLAVLLLAALLIALGMLIGQPSAGRAEEGARSQKYTECAAVSTYVNAGKAINGGREPERTLRVPQGWTPIGGAANGGEPVVVFCR